MIKSRAVGAALIVAAALMLSGCFAESTPPEQPPTTVKTIGELQGAEIQLAAGETLGIDTQGQDPAVYDAMILDGSVAAYQPSRDGSQIRIEGVAHGTTDVLLGDPDGTVEEVSFTLTVTD